MKLSPAHSFRRSLSARQASHHGIHEPVGQPFLGPSPGGAQQPSHPLRHQDQAGRRHRLGGEQPGGDANQLDQLQRRQPSPLYRVQLQGAIRIIIFSF